MQIENINLDDYPKEILEWNKEIIPSDVMKLDNNFSEALKKLAEIERVFQKLPKINCGACGAPTCHAFAEDIVKGITTIEECVVLKSKMKGGNNESY